MSFRFGCPRIEQIIGADHVVRVQIANAKRFEQLTHGGGIVLLERMPEWIDGRTGSHHYVGPTARMLWHETGDIVDARTV